MFWLFWKVDKLKMFIFWKVVLMIWKFDKLKMCWHSYTHSLKLGVHRFHTWYNLTITLSVNSFLDSPQFSQMWLGILYVEPVLWFMGYLLFQLSELRICMNVIWFFLHNSSRCMFGIWSFHTQVLITIKGELTYYDMEMSLK